MRMTTAMNACKPLCRISSSRDHGLPGAGPCARAHFREVTDVSLYAMADSLVRLQRVQAASPLLAP